ncbi:unnamed protein product [marine sediment metagenome]|uniref:Uncharacterized protein n=1 Tax=marine sediment metagenome TaxID=412755 RepID=X1P088_9ZZZZ
MPLTNPQDAAAAISVHTAIADAHQTTREVKAGTYTGDASDDRQIAVGFKCKIVFVFRNLTNPTQWICHMQTEAAKFLLGGASSQASDLELHATDGFVVDNMTCNILDDVYNYLAISE